MSTILLLYMGDETVTAGAGTERVLTNMANELVKRGYHVIVATNDAENAVAYFPFDEHVETIYLNLEHIRMPLMVKIKREINRIFPIMDKPFEVYWSDLSAKKLIQRLQGRKIDCIVAYNHEAIQVASHGYLNKIPMACMIHNSIKVLGHQHAVLIDKKENDVVQVLMPSYVQKIKKYIKHTPVIWIPNVVYPVKENNYANLTLTKSVYKIITVGRVEPQQKQTHLLVEAFAKLADKYPNWQVDIWGEFRKNSPYGRRILQIIEKENLQKRVFLRGLSHNIQSELQKADIFAFPSAYEGFSLAMTEAMSVGLPSVGFRSADAVNELIVDGENGILCDDGAVAFARGLETLMKNRELRVQMGRRAIEMMQPYAPKAVWDKWQHLIENLIHHRNIKGD